MHAYMQFELLRNDLYSCVMVDLYPGQFEILHLDDTPHCTKQLLVVI